MSETSEHPDHLFREALSGSLSASQRRRLDTHLEDCERCRSEFGELRATLELLEEYEPAPPSEERMDRIEARIAKRMTDRSAAMRAKPDSPASRGVVWGLRAAAALVFIASGVLLGRYIHVGGSQNAEPDKPGASSSQPTNQGEATSRPPTSTDSANARGRVEDPDPFRPLKEPPRLIGGTASIQEHLEYPELAIINDVEGVVIVKFTVGPTGDVIDPQVVPGTGLGSGCDEAAVEAIQAARFEPAMQAGRPVAVDMTIPVRFELTKAE